MKVVDYGPIERQKKYRGKYLVVKESYTSGKVTVIAFGKDPQKVLDQAWAKGCKEPLLTRVSAKKPSAPVFYNAA